jgi:hypothetical protein
MALEDEIKGLRSDIQELTAHLKGAGKATGGAASGGKADKKAAPKHTAEEVTALCVRVKNEIDADTAKKLIKDHGKADALKQVQPENYDALAAACEAALAEKENGGGDL